MCEVSSLPVTMEKSSKDYEGTPVCKSHPLAEPGDRLGLLVLRGVCSKSIGRPTRTLTLIDQWTHHADH